jgi:hypothetical protein
MDELERLLEAVLFAYDPCGPSYETVANELPEIASLHAHVRSLIAAERERCAMMCTRASAEYANGSVVMALVNVAAEIRRG